LQLPNGCVPTVTDFLIVYPPNQDTPNARFVKHQVTLPNGKVPSFNSTIVDGETWYGFSYNLQWNPTQPLYLYVEGMIHRFDKEA
jgi:hypothetical protein